MHQSDESTAKAQAAKEKKETSYDVKKIYWDAYGNLRLGRRDPFPLRFTRLNSFVGVVPGSTERNRDQEILDILKSDTNDESDPTKLWCAMPSSHWDDLSLQVTISFLHIDRF